MAFCCISCHNNDSCSIDQDSVQLLKDGIDVITDADKLLSNLLSYPLYSTLASSPESKTVIEDKLSEVAASLLAAYDSGEFVRALEESSGGWQKWGQNVQGKFLFMPLRVLLTGMLHGPEMGSALLLIYEAGKCGVIAPQSGLVTLDERFKMLREVDLGFAQ
ncbi:glutamate-tRNA ligase [Striga asiatica]|uniref:Glutamate-tRNA ligase n=1 Tax=Striga asiatica TaxID=4170 RepID=A0A5A7NZ03_STRAF|nr:glutamate-tRNA ligase [Striga asiatica]